MLPGGRSCAVIRSRLRPTKSVLVEVSGVSQYLTLRPNGGGYSLSRSLVLALRAILIAGLTSSALAKIHLGDRGAVFVYNKPELSGQATVDGSGLISLRLAGGVEATNLDPSQIAQRARYRLKPDVRPVAADVQSASRPPSQPRTQIAVAANAQPARQAASGRSMPAAVRSDRAARRSCSPRTPLSYATSPPRSPFVVRSSCPA
jgi:protein involved in polysaccharide export with SLBB domain